MSKDTKDLDSGTDTPAAKPRPEASDKAATPPAGIPALDPKVADKQAAIEAALRGPMLPPPHTGRMTPVGPPSQVPPQQRGHTPPAAQPQAQPLPIQNPIFGPATTPEAPEAREALARLRDSLRSVLVAIQAADKAFVETAPILGRAEAEPVLTAASFSLDSAAAFMQDARKLLTDHNR